jgi:HK97 family phage portal protein
MLTNLRKKALKWMMKSLAPVDNRGWYTIYESYGGAFQSDVQISPEVALAHPTVFACVTQIASDIGKLRLRLTEFKDKIWVETVAYSPIFRKPNHYQTRQKFIEQWIISKLIHGNTYILKERDDKGRVNALYILDPLKVKVLVSDNGMVFYQLKKDNLSGIGDDVQAAPAIEIIHDSMECLFHPLVGIPPLFAGGLAAQQGLNTQKNSTYFFGNSSQPGGILTTNFSGENAGKVAVLGDGLKFEPMRMTAVDSQLIQQLKWSDEKVCSVFKVPPYKVYAGPLPASLNTEVIDRIYYSGCLQRHIESIEQLLDNGLELPQNLGTEFDLDDLMRMDTETKMKVTADGVGAGIIAPNEGRRRFSLPPVKGGDTPYLQVQNYSLAALDARDKDNPLAVYPPTPPPPPKKDITDKALYLLFSKGMENEADA